MNGIIPSKLLNDIEFAFRQYSELPLCIHVTDLHGRFILANKDARNLFGLSDDLVLSTCTITDYYEDARERDYVLRELRKVVPGSWRKDFKVLLKIRGERCMVRFSSKPFFDEKGEILLMLNITENMSRLEWYADLEDEFELGLFEVDRHLNITDCNQYLSEMLGYDQPEDIKGRSIAHFFWEPYSIKRLLATLKRQPDLRRLSLKLKRKDGAMSLVEMSCNAINLQHGQTSRVKGVIRDVTFKVIYDDLPVGLFLISNSPTGGGDVISRVNLTFAKMHAFESVEEVLGNPSDIFRPNKSTDYDNYEMALKKAGEMEKPLLDYYMQIVDRKGEIHNVVVNVLFLPGSNNQIRVGAVYDLTNHVAKNIRTLNADFGAVLHTYIATVNGLRDTLSILLKAHGYDVLVNDKALNQNRVTELLEHHKSLLGSLLTELEPSLLELQQDNLLLESIKKSWRRLVEKKQEGEKDNAAWIRRNMIEIRSALEAYRSGILPSGLFQSIRSEINELLRLTTVISISYALDELNERIFEFYYFRDYLRGKDSEHEDTKPQNLVTILLDSLKFLEEFASVRKVALVQNLQVNDIVLVNCNRTTLSRAFHSLIHNAIKYSLDRRGDHSPYVEVRLEQKGKMVEILIINWGIGIHQEELEHEEIFQFGKRGRETNDQGRSGTGIGLYDARNIINKLGGDLRLSSVPAMGNALDPNQKPYITTAYITLPIFKAP